MYSMHWTIALLLLCFIFGVMGHARIKHPRPLAASDDSPAGNYYNAPLRPDGSDFPCKGLHKKAGVNKTPTETWRAGEMTRFEILGHGSSGEGSLAAHSGGSCQASISFDNGETWKVLHTFIGGCPRGARLGSNIADKNQTFPFMVPANTKAGIALFSWSWIAVTGNRNEMYQNCAVVEITGSGTSTLDDLPDMFVGDMTLPGQIGAGQCRSYSGNAIEFPNPGTAKTITSMPSIGFKKPTGGNCFAKRSSNNQTASSASTKASVTRATTPTRSTASTRPTTTRATTPTRPTTTRATTSTRPTTTRATTSTRPATTHITTTVPLNFTIPTGIPADGKLPSQCTIYKLITDSNRRATAASGVACDKDVFKAMPTWVRFSGGAGTRLVTGAAEPFRCGTQGVGWFKGEYPSAAGATIEGTVCYSWPGKSCQWSNTIWVTNCKEYYVFALPAPPVCRLRYCTA